MSLTSLGVAANILGVITPAKDVGEIIKAIAASFEAVKNNKESISYWDKVLKDYAKEVYSLMIWCKGEGATDSQLRSLAELLESLVLFRKELIEIDKCTYLEQWYMSRNSTKKINIVEKKMRQCRDLFLVQTLSTHTMMLSRIQSKQIDEIVDRRSRNFSVERTTIRWKTPGKANFSDHSLLDYVYLRRKAHMLIHALKTNVGRIQDLLYRDRQEFELTTSFQPCHPIGNPLKECESASHDAVRLFWSLEGKSLDGSFLGWFEDLRRLSVSLYCVGLGKECRQINEFICQLWATLASRTGLAFVHTSFALSLRNLAISYSDEGTILVALSLVEKGIRIHRISTRKESKETTNTLGSLAECLRLRSDCLLALCRYDEALESAKESVVIFRKLVNNDSDIYNIEFARSLVVQSEIYHCLSQYTDALECSIEAVQWLTKLTQSAPNETAQAFWNIAKAYRALGDSQRAKDYGRRTLTTYHELVNDHPLYYSFALSYTVTFLSWFGHEEALSILDDFLALCLAIDITLTAPYSADVWELRAEAFISCNQHEKALECYDQIINIHRRLVDDGEDGDTRQFKRLLEVFRFRSSCLLSLRRQRDAAASLDAAQDAVVSRLKSEIDEQVLLDLVEELEEQYKLFDELTNPVCSSLFPSLKNYTKVFTTILEIRLRVKNAAMKRQDQGLLHMLEYWIQIFLGRFDMALMCIQDARTFYSSEVHLELDFDLRLTLVHSLEWQVRTCAGSENFTEAIGFLDEALQHIKSLLEIETNDDMFHGFWKLLSFFDENITTLVKKCGCRRLLLSLEAVVKLLNTTHFSHDPRTHVALGRLLPHINKISYSLGRYSEAIFAANQTIDIYRRLATLRTTPHERHLANSLYLHAKSLLATNNADAALMSVDEAVDIQLRIERKTPDDVHSDLTASLSLRAEILYRLGQVAPAKDALTVVEAS